jgi:hypothetical protein
MFAIGGKADIKVGLPRNRSARTGESRRLADSRQRFDALNSERSVF